jgi:integrase
MELYQRGELLPHEVTPTMEVYSGGWFIDGRCEYIKLKTMMKEPLKQSSLDTHKKNLAGHLIPYFGNMKLNEIDRDAVMTWLLEYSERGYKNTYINNIMMTLRVMMGEAARQKIIKENPMKDIEKLPNDAKEIQILSPAEVQALFPPKWNTMWDTFQVYVVNKLAAFTGMRIGELVGMRGEFVFRDYISICGQWSKEYGYTDTKTGKSRDIPIIKELRDELNVLKADNGDGYLFSTDGGKNPISRNRIYQELYRALGKIGIDHDTRLKRGLSVHGWRHYLNTALRMANVPDAKIREITGHESREMTDLYTHFDTKQFTEVLAVQKNIIKKAKQKTAGTGKKPKPALKLVKPSTAKKPKPVLKLVKPDTKSKQAATKKGA